MMAEAVKYQESTCDFCFKMAPPKDTFRCKHCKAKLYCGRECQAADWELVHSRICSRLRGERRRRKGTKDRAELGKADARSLLNQNSEVQVKNCVKTYGIDVDGFRHHLSITDDLRRSYGQAGRGTVLVARRPQEVRRRLWALAKLQG